VVGEQGSQQNSAGRRQLVDEFPQSLRDVGVGDALFGACRWVSDSFWPRADGVWGGLGLAQDAEAFAARGGR
jgi:hypothetical protein